MERSTPFGKYFLLERINVGGMAEVFKAKAVGVEGFEKLVAIKRILPSVAEDEDFIKMFVDEAKISSQLFHPNLAQTFDLGKINDTYYIAMEYVPGKDLRAVFERLKRRGDRMPLPLVAYVMARVGEGLDYAHRKRDHNGEELHIVHRDVSPQNVIVSFEGEVKLIDFGIAKAANKITRTQAGILKGKFGYMSPEQVRGLPLDRRSDIFAAGVVLYELCTGERLFTGSSDFSVLEKVQAARVTPPSQLDPQIPLKLERVILKALAREPEERYQQAADLASDLMRFLLETQGRSVSRDDLAAFMGATFPDDSAREHAELDATRTRAPRRPPPDVRGAQQASGERVAARTERSEPPPLPPSLTADLDPFTPAEPGRRRGADGSRSTGQGAPRPSGTPLPAFAASQPLPAAPLERAGDAPTRPMSMEELAAAERKLVENQRYVPAAGSPTIEVSDEATEPGVFVDGVGPPAREPPPFEGRGHVPKPTLVGDDPLPADETTVSTLTRRARWLRRGQLAVLVLALGVALWAWLSVPHSKKSDRSGAAPSGSLAVTTQPEDAVVLPGQLTVRSSPAGAQVFLDGQKRGATPAYLPDVDPDKAHALVLEKRCFRPWQVAVPAHAGRREVAATLEAVPGACAGKRVAQEEKPAPPVPADDPAAMASLGFLSLGSRPSANVFIDGVDIGRTTPLLAWPLKVGAHKIRLVVGGRKKEVPVEILSGQTHSEIVDLRKR